MSKPLTAPQATPMTDEEIEAIRNAWQSFTTLGTARWWDLGLRLLATIDVDRGRIKSLVEALRDFCNLHPFGKTGECISCGGKAENYPGQIHYPNCLWVRVGNGILHEMTRVELKVRSEMTGKAT